MIKISGRAIDETLAQTALAYREGRLAQFQLGIEESVREKRFLSSYIDSGSEYLERVTGKDGALLRGRYRSGAHLTFRMIEAQLAIDGRQSPTITEENVITAGESRKEILEMNVRDVIMAKIAQIRKNDREFGDYVTNYIRFQAPHEMVSQGFALGVITTYSAYEQVIKY